MIRSSSELGGFYIQGNSGVSATTWYEPFTRGEQNLHGGTQTRSEDWQNVSANCTHVERDKNKWVSDILSRNSIKYRLIQFQIEHTVTLITDT